MFDLTRFYIMTKTRQPILSPYVDRASNAAAATIVQCTHTAVPNDMILLVNSWVVQAQPGAAQKSQSINGFYLPMGSNVLFLLWGENTDPNLAAAITANFTLKNELLMMPSTVIKVNANFDVGTASNTVNSLIRGFLIPKANFPRVE